MADGILNPIEQLEADFDFDVYTKQEVDALLDEKADADAVYTKTETDNLLDAKADKSTTLAGYGITDAYTKTQTDNLLNGKADADSVYTKTEIDTKIPNSVGSATKPTYVNGGVITECAYELNKTVPANAVFTDTTYTAGNGLNLSGTSFSAKAGTNVSVDGNGINVNGSGVVASADSGLISGGTAYTELRPTLDGTWVKNAQTTATNLQKLEGGIEYLYGLLSHQYDQLKKYINGNYYDYQTDSDTKYVKTVPQGAMPYASLDSIGGKTLVWNQLCSSTTFPTTHGENGGTTAWNGTEVTYGGTVTSTSWLWVGSSSVLIPANNHIYLALTDNIQSGLRFGIINAIGSFAYEADDTKYYRFTNSNGIKALNFRIPANTVVNFTAHLMLFDLTLMFGAGNEPTTVAEFQQMFPASYYPYNAGTLLSAGVTEVVSKDSNNATLQTVSIPAEIRNIEGYGWSAGSVYNYIDYERKVFVKNVGRADLGTRTYTYRTDTTMPIFQMATTGMGIVAPGGSGTFTANAVCPLYVTTNSNNVSQNGYDKCLAVSADGGRIYIQDSSYTNATTFTSAMNGIYMYYELATPIEVDISEYLTDDNLIEVESGGTLTFPNSNGDDYRIPVPSAETYMVDLQSAI